MYPVEPRRNIRPSRFHAHQMKWKGTHYSSDRCLANKGSLGYREVLGNTGHPGVLWERATRPWRETLIRRGHERRFPWARKHILTARWISPLRVCSTRNPRVAWAISICDKEWSGPMGADSDLSGTLLVTGIFKRNRIRCASPERTLLINLGIGAHLRWLTQTS